MKIIKEQFLPAITTISAKFNVGGNSWQNKIKEIDELGLEKVAIFPTCLNREQRQEMYSLLEKTHIKEIPFVHLRSDMFLEELDYLVEKFKVQVFNIHTERQWPLQFDLSKYKRVIFIENARFPLQYQEIEKFGGICLDFSHLENEQLLFPEKYKEETELLLKHKIGCNHIAAISKVPLTETEEEGPFNPYKHKYIHHDKHIFENLGEFDYLKNYPKEFFSNYCAIEIENSLKEQLAAIEYIVSLLNNI